jgi:hypothetical protein
VYEKVQLLNHPDVKVHAGSGALQPAHVSILVSTTKNLEEKVTGEETDAEEMLDARILKTERPMKRLKYYSLDRVSKTTQDYAKYEETAVVDRLDAGSGQLGDAACRRKRTRHEISSPASRRSNAHGSAASPAPEVTSAATVFSIILFAGC